ncbi:hypothetical protein ACCO45_003584 [Purpureocillium lilacinum]|uniref:Uncharacterized protein n=1 Tax=Purpureocillium lilacinum TaxID=33203 RepID=A0ACC4E0M5_PURLI
MYLETNDSASVPRSTMAPSGMVPGQAARQPGLVLTLSLLRANGRLTLALNSGCQTPHSSGPASGTSSEDAPQHYDD